MSEEQEQPTYKTPCFQLTRQIFMLIITIITSAMSLLITFITQKINDSMDILEEQIKNGSISKIN